MKTNVEVEVLLNRSSPQHSMEVSSRIHVPAALIQRNNSGTRWIGGWVSPRAGQDAVG
jgi:hypothetical protein